MERGAAKGKAMAVSMLGRKGSGAGRRLLVRLGYTVCGALALALAVGGAQIPRLLASSSHFRLAALEVTGLHLLHGQDVLVASGLGIGDNIYAVDLEAVAARLAEVPWIDRAYLERLPPARLAVSIVERRRLAWVALDAIYGVDRDGVLLPGEKHPEEQRRDLDLPVITGLELKKDPYAPYRPGVRLTDPGALRVLRWWGQARECAPEFCLNVSEMRPLADDGVRILLVGDGLEVRLLADRVEEHLGVLAQLMTRLYRECPGPAYVDLRYAGQVVVGLRPPGDEDPPDQKS